VLNKAKIRNYFLVFFLGLAVLFLFQNCGQFKLSPKARDTAATSFTSMMDVTLRPPTEFAWHRRYIFLVDMSYSMVSGPCPFDIDVSDSTHGFTGAYKDYDPNFPTEGVNYLDARARVADCSLNENLNYGQMTLDYSQPNNSNYLPNHKTFKGHDFDGNRFKVIREWITQMKNSNNLEFLQRTKILLIPSGGGVAYERLLAQYPQSLEFLPLNDSRLEASLINLEVIHNETKDWAKMPPSDRFANFDPNLEALKMGTSSLNFAYDKIFKVTDLEMQKFAESNELTHTTFKLFSFGDQRTNPVNSQFDKALSYYSTCLECLPSLEKAWGRKEDDQLEAVDLKLSLIQGLNKYYGSGFFDSDFFNMQSQPVQNPIRYTANSGNTQYTGEEFPQNQRNVIDFLNQRSFDRKASSRIFTQNKALPPYRLVNSNSGITTFKTTHIFVLNANFKIDNNGKGEADTDGDGLVDSKEAVYNLSPLNSRSNNLCLDVLMTEEAYKSRCESLAASKLCHAELDSDGDTLNECEELTIGTDPFDFDSDGDGIPDSLEVIYGFNPLFDDNRADSNGDGLTNIMSLGMGLNPSVLPVQVPANDLTKVLLNYLEQQTVNSVNLGLVKTDVFKLDVTSFPFINSGLVASEFPVQYLIRPGSKGFNASAQVPFYHQLISPVSTVGTNKLLGIIRVVDPDEPLRVYWEIFDLELNSNNLGQFRTLDLSKFSQIKVIDRVRLVK
jgi:hypothetical protein